MSATKPRPRYGWNLGNTATAFVVGDRVTIRSLRVHIAGTTTKVVDWPEGTVISVTLPDSIQVKWDKHPGSSFHSLTSGLQRI